MILNIVTGEYFKMHCEGAKNMNIGYVRVSTVEQNEARQMEALKQYQIDKFFVEKISGKNMDRPELQKLLTYCREGDVIFVLDFSRLSRSVKDLLQLIEKLNDKKVRLVSLKENFDLCTPTGRLMMNLIASINEFERMNLLERQKEGIAIAKQNHKYKGRKPTQYDTQLLNEVLSGLKNKSLTVTGASKALNVSRVTIYHLMEKYGISNS